MWIEILVASLLTQESTAGLRSQWTEDYQLRALGPLAKLTTLDLSHTRLTDIGFRELRGAENVERVNLYYAENVGDGALVVMKNWRQLRELNLRGTKVTDLGVAQLSEHPNVESVDVGFSLFTDNGLEALTTMPKLKRLTCGGNKLTDTGLSALRLMTGLTALDISG